MRSQLPVRHLLVWLAAGAACWSVLAVAAFAAPQALLALGALVALPWLRHPRTIAETGGAEPTLPWAPSAEVAAAGHERELVAQTA